MQIGTAYLPSAESTISGLHRAALEQARDDATVLTNVFTGRPARGLANRIVREIRTDDSGRAGISDGGQGDGVDQGRGRGDRLERILAALVGAGRESLPSGGAAELTRALAASALERLRALGSPR